MRSSEPLSWQRLVLRRGDAPLRLVLRDEANKATYGWLQKWHLHRASAQLQAEAEPGCCGTLWKQAERLHTAKSRLSSALQAVLGLQTWHPGGSCWLTWTTCALASNSGLGCGQPWQHKALQRPRKLKCSGLSCPGGCRGLRLRMKVEPSCCGGWRHCLSSRLRSLPRHAHASTQQVSSSSFAATCGVQPSTVHCATKRARLPRAGPRALGGSLSVCCWAGRWFGCASLYVDVDTLAAGKRHGVELLEELGRGMFGKVFRGARPGHWVARSACPSLRLLPQRTSYQHRHCQHARALLPKAPAKLIIRLLQADKLSNTALRVAGPWCWGAVHAGYPHTRL